jgi:hypothetical protein
MIRPSGPGVGDGIATCRAGEAATGTCDQSSNIPAKNKTKAKIVLVFIALPAGIISSSRLVK